MVFAGGLVGIVLAAINKRGFPYVVYIIACTQVIEAYQFWYLTLVIVMMPLFSAVFDD